jgi:hypothetical protein
MNRSATLTALVLVLSGTSACLAPPPPMVVETPYGDVHAEDRSTAAEVATMLRALAPEVMERLPGSQDRAIDVWVQDRLRVYRYNERPQSVRGFTLLSDEFDARRIHLQEDGQSPWYLAHELVHALIGPSWAPLPGILEEGLADVIAEGLSPEHQNHIRAHRLLNATAFSDGLRVVVGHRPPGGDALSRGSAEYRRALRLRLTRSVPVETARELFATTRTELHQRWPEIPESFYGLAWLLVSRAVERHGVEGLHELCLRATEEGHELVPAGWLLEAANLDLDELDPEFISACFEKDEFQRAIYLQPEAFAIAALEALRPLEPDLDERELFYVARPVFVLWDGSRIPLSTIGPVREEIQARWRVRPAVDARHRRQY